ncbi:MAG: hypothetical protein Q4D05_08295 [Acinetobacter sp.]|nr:hypothetical protein [Acinetobacter sp.]
MHATQRIDAYLDFATIPTLHYFLHFIEHMQQTDIIRLFGLSRFKIPESIIHAYPQGTIQYCHVQPAQQEAFNDLLAHNLAQYTAVDLHLHLNHFHAFEMFPPLLQIIEHYQAHIQSVKLYFYDDGSEGVVNLHHICQQLEDIPHVIEYAKQHHYDFLRQGTAYSDLKAIGRYLWQHIFPSEYHLFNSELVKQTPILQQLIPHYHDMDFERVQHLSKEQKDIFYQLCNVQSQKIEQLVQASHQITFIVLTGTTLFDMNEQQEQFLERIHTQLLQQYRNANIDTQQAIICFKGHPHSAHINQRLKTIFADRIAFLPDEIPLELFFIAGLKVQHMAGFASSSYFSCPKQAIGHVFFLSQDEHGFIPQYIAQGQHSLKRIMLDLAYVQPHQAHHHQQLFSH